MTRLPLRLSGPQVEALCDALWPERASRCRWHSVAALAWNGWPRVDWRVQRPRWAR